MAALFIIAPKWKQPKRLPVGERINKNGIWNTIQQ